MVPYSRLPNSLLVLIIIIRELLRIRIAKQLILFQLPDPDMDIVRAIGVPLLGPFHGEARQHQSSHYLHLAHIAPDLCYDIQMGHDVGEGILFKLQI